jgi:hypothetical protein
VGRRYGTGSCRWVRLPARLPAVSLSWSRSWSGRGAGGRAGSGAGPGFVAASCCGSGGPEGCARSSGDRSAPAVLEELNLPVPVPSKRLFRPAAGRPDVCGRADCGVCRSSGTRPTGGARDRRGGAPARPWRRTGPARGRSARGWAPTERPPWGGPRGPRPAQADPPDTVQPMPAPAASMVTTGRMTWVRGNLWPPHGESPVSGPWLSAVWPFSSFSSRS